jgi:hypothetical protein
METDEYLSDGGLTWLKGGEFEKGCALLYYSANLISRIHLWFNGTGVGADDPILYRPCTVFWRGSWWGGGGGREY